MAAVLLLAGTRLASAQQVGTIRGTTYDADFDMPLADVRVTIAETEETLTSGDQGTYAFPEVTPGSYTLVFTREGYVREVEGGVTVEGGQVTTVDATLGGDFTDMQEFVVRDLRLDAGSEAVLLDLRFEAPQLLDSIGSDFLSRAGASDAAAGLRLVSGATTTSEGFAAVRGLPPRFVNTQLNGFSLPSANPDSRAVQLDLFPSDVVESIQVSKTFTPDQQGSASGGGVNVVTRSIPDENFLSFSSKAEMNSRRAGSGEFLRDSRGRVPYFGMDGSRELPGSLQGLSDPPPTLPPTTFGSPAPGFGDAPVQYGWGATGGLQHEFDSGVRVGGLATFFWDQDVSHDDSRVNNDLVAKVGDFDLGLIPDVSTDGSQGFLDEDPDAGDQVLTSLFDEVVSEQEVSWGGLGTIGLESENHAVNFTFLNTHITTSTVTLAEDTRGKLLKFPGHEPDQVTTPGGRNDPESGDDLRQFAPFRRLETQEYIERSVQSFQFNGRHTLALFEEPAEDERWALLPPGFDWNAAFSGSERHEPGTLIFDSKYLSASGNAPEGEQRPVSFEDAGGSLGAFNVVFRDIEEQSAQYRLNLEQPFKQWSGDEGYVKVGLFDDSTTRDFAQDTFAIPTGTQNFVFLSPFDGPRLSEAITYPEAFEGMYGLRFPAFPPGPANPEQNDPGELTPSGIDFRFDGQQDIEAWYWMADVPLNSYVKVIGGLRFESTRLSTDLIPDGGSVDGVLIDAKELNDLGVPPGNTNSTSFLESQGVSLDAQIDQDDVLPSIGLVVTPTESLTLRGGYSETVARPTFRELTPISQSLFAGDTPFVGNPFLQMSAVKNYDLRIDYRPERGSLLSVSYFQKHLDDPIQVIQQAQGTTDLILPVNFPEGEIEGWEFEARQDLGLFVEELEGLSIGGNLTLLDTQVTLREYEISRLAAAGAPQRTLPMTNAPEYLYNLFVTYDFERTGTQASLFYTVRGDTLIASPGVQGDVGTPNFFIPGVYDRSYGTLNFTLSQAIGDHITLSFSAKNLTDPSIETVYRSPFVPGGDVVRTSRRDGIDFSIGIRANFTF